MPRPRKRRFMGRLPHLAVYKPAGIALNDLNQVLLLPEELEALRLSDLERLSQEEAAGRMQVSRSTFQRILAHARRQVSLALVEGYALVIEQASPAGRPAAGRGSRQAGEPG
jgi:predicted DNA-binding protein (UPF0251 family)